MEAALASFIAKGTPSGWTLCVLVVIGIIILLKILAGQRPKMQELEIGSDQQFRADLIERVTKLETELRDTRAHYEEKLERLTAAHEAEVRIARHELGNAKMRFRALVMLLKRLPAPPEGLTAILADIEAMEAEQAVAEAAEKGAVSAAKITAAAPGRIVL